MNFLELCKRRYSERKFDTRPIEEKKLLYILEAGRLAPTACNFQPQRIYVLNREETLNPVRKATYGAPVALLVCYDMNAAWRIASDRYYENFNSGEQDASIVATMMMMAATEQGIHSSWVRGFDSKELAETYNLPENVRPVMLLALGYPMRESAPARMHPSRKPLEETVTTL